MNNDEINEYNLFNILTNDDSESLDNFLQNCTNENDVNSCFEKLKIPRSVLKFDQRTKIKMISLSTFYSYGDNVPILSISALFGSINCFNLLLICGADISLPDSSGRLPVHFACAGGCIEICDILDSSGADFTQNDKFNRSCLHYACISGNIALVERLWYRNFNLEQQDSYLMKPIHFTSLCNNFLEEDENDFRCLHDGSEEVFDFLINKGCDINAISKDGSTPFTLALQYSPSVLNYLIENWNFNISIKPCSKSIDKEKTSNSNDKVMAKFIYNRNAYDDLLNDINNIKNPNDNTKSNDQEKNNPLIEDNNDNNLIDLNNFFLYDEEEDDLVLPLIDACRKKRFGIVAALLKRNQVFPYNDIENETNNVIQIEDKEPSPLNNKNTRFFSLIDVEQKDIFGWTPLLYAAERGSLSITKLLVKKGANVNAKSKNGFSPLLAAKNRNYPNIALFLEKNGALLHP